MTAGNDAEGGDEAVTFDLFLQEAAQLEGLAWRIKELGLDSFDAYLDLLRSDPEGRFCDRGKSRAPVSLRCIRRCKEG